MLRYRPGSQLYRVMVEARGVCKETREPTYGQLLRIPQMFTSTLDMSVNS